MMYGFFFKFGDVLLRMRNGSVTIRSREHNQMRKNQCFVNEHQGTPSVLTKIRPSPIVVEVLEA